ncbi:hypothetical protein ElyMa_002251900 [Elysia marginata]|uniref:Uncharacterized protein n=1 Tax=Elysia marginata TaxID=1093978 RepID=A0AAV4FYL1_9GAST|nr:hypothetical protein ElyMa_002251900 [Elysia marginata]
MDVDQASKCFFTKRIRYVAVIIVLFYTFHTIDACNGAHKETSSDSLSTPKAHAPQYHEFWVFARHTLSQDAKSRQNENAAIPEDILNVFRRIENIRSSLLLNTAGVGYAKSSREDRFDLEKEVALKTLVSSLDTLAQTSKASDRCINDTSFLFTSVFQGHGSALKCNFIIF